MKITDELFLTISNILGSRVTPSNFKKKLKEIEHIGSFANKQKADILVELVLAISELEKKINEQV